MKNIISLLLLFYFNYSLFSQRETDNWYFGNKAGLHFNAGNIDILNDSQLNTFAGSSSISDDQGNLVLYTNGQTVWNKNHQIMLNGEDLIGEINNTQPTLIVPKPNSNNTYYVFSTRTTELNSPLRYPGVYFSEIEFSTLYPLGRVKYKNMRLTHSTADKITAVHHKNGEDIWVITYGSDSYEGTDNIFKAYKVTEDGVDRQPTQSILNEIEKKRLGQMKASPDGSKVALIAGTFLYTFYFDNTTGNLTLNKQVQLQTSFSEGYAAYGLSFSPNSKLLYYPALRYTDSGNTYRIMQYDFNNTIEGYLGDTVYKTSPDRTAASMELGSDGRIYVVQTVVVNKYDVDGFYIGFEMNQIKTIGIINEPNKLGEASDYQHDVIDLEEGWSYRGTPNFIQSYFRNRIITENKCVTDTFNFSLDAYTPITEAKWDFGDGATSNDFNPTHQYSSAGDFIVTCLVTINGKEIPFYKKVTVYPLPVVVPNQELVQCDIDNNGIDYFDLFDIGSKVVRGFNNQDFIFYRNLLDAENDENRIPNPEAFENETNPQELFVRVLSEKGCASITNFFIESKFVELGGIPDYNSCDSSDLLNGDLKASFSLSQKRRQIRDNFNLNNGETIRFFPTLFDAQITENLLSDIYISPSTTIYVRVDTDLGCGGIEPLKLLVNSPIIDLEDSYVICNEPSIHSPVIIEGNNTSDRYEWKNQAGNILSTNREFTLTTTGTFSLTVYKTENGIECSNSKNFTVVNPIGPTLNQVIVDTETENNMVYVSVIGSNSNSSYQYSLDNENFYGNGLSYLFNNVEPGIKTIYINDIDNCESSLETEIAVIGFPKFLTPNNDGNNDTWSVKGATSDFFKNVDIYIFDRYGKTIHTINLTNQENGWDGTFNGIELPTRNYWYKAILVDNNDNTIERTGSIGLIR
ncbi:T9SS type B sorting domain-containing protein [Tenacibaculum sp. 1_MG-2023]|uniref:T9SS type B sorting domain-containing protein n=1 Tax=Tenacibaculum sp. 1_MG-2023 TaxID=3062653 RepID=UPI0026E18FF2|nr:T9SS type B sorting domain-containing protein [Tenacibaculum sp. 1_MG-2023]MDO6601033.1 T9SS type B sorting domain-containing protein [Tenacibaculum sp. 1_MG-2023]